MTTVTVSILAGMQAAAAMVGLGWILYLAGRHIEVVLRTDYGLDVSILKLLNTFFSPIFMKLPIYQIIIHGY